MSTNDTNGENENKEVQKTTTENEAENGCQKWWKSGKKSILEVRKSTFWIQGADFETV